MDTSLKLHGLVAAVHTPFKADGSLNPSSVDAQAKLLASQGIKLAFITGSTGESSSMQLEASVCRLKSQVQESIR